MENEDKRVQELKEKYKNFDLHNNENNIKKEENKNDLEYQGFLEWKKEKEKQNEEIQAGEQNKDKIFKKNDLDKDKIVLKWFSIFIVIIILNLSLGLFYRWIHESNFNDIFELFSYITQFIINFSFLTYSTNILIDSKHDSQKSKYIKIFFIYILVLVTYAVGLAISGLDSIGGALMWLSILILAGLYLIISWFKIYKQKYSKIEYFIIPTIIFLIPLIIKIIIWIV